MTKLLLKISALVKYQARASVRSLIKTKIFEKLRNFYGSFEKFGIIVKMRGVKIKHIFLIIGVLIAILIIDQSGLLLHLNAKDFHKEFEYPMKGNIEPYMEQLRTGKEPSVTPINPHDYMMIRQAKGKCSLDFDDDGHEKNVRVVYLVKSAMEHFKRREVIRKTWGYERFVQIPIFTNFSVKNC